jgi:O-succinylbenzoic acid--CoA ligase
MDPHSLAEPEFWQNDSSFLLEAGRISVVEGLPYPSLVFLTSGSTGVSRRIVLAKKSLLISAAAVNAHLSVDDQSVWGLCLPWWHVGGLGIIARSYQSRAGVSIFSARWQANECVEWLREKTVTHLSLVPTQVHDLVSLGQDAPESLRAIVVGGGRLENSLGQRARELGWPVLASYGMTEAGSQIATQSLAALSSPYASEPLPIIPCWQVRCGDERLEIRGDALFHGEMVFENSEWRYRARSGDWYATQDCGVLAADGLRVTHRADSLVKILGELVNPAQIESDLIEAGLPVGRFAVMVVGDDRKENRLVLVHENLDPTLVSNALEIYHEGCTGFSRIEDTHSLANFPRSDLGKILREQLSIQIATFSKIGSRDSGR